MADFDIAPIAIFAFNRPDHLGRTLEALSTNKLAEQSHVTFFCDGPRDSVKYPEDEAKCAAVREIALRSQGFASVKVVERVQNMGCANSVIDGLAQMFAKHDRLIVIEDDILTSPHTLAFLNDGLTRYVNVSEVFNISAWSLPPNLLSRPRNSAYDVFCLSRFICWGWASWSDRFKGLDWEVKNFSELQNDKQMQRAFCAGGDDLYPMLQSQMRGEIDSWYIRAEWWRFQQRQVSITPFYSYSTNIGFGSGTHTLTEETRLNNNICLALPLQQVRWITSYVTDKKLLYCYKCHFISLRQRIKIKMKDILKKVHLLDFCLKIKRCLMPGNVAKK